MILKEDMKMADLEKEFDAVIDECFGLFKDKLSDYGPTWLFFRNSSLIDQLWIKAKRIAVLEENDDNSLVGEGRDGEYIGIINYSIVMLFRILYPDALPEYDKLLVNPELAETVSIDDILELYKKVVKEVKALMIRKNHDYGDAWRGMQQSSITDMIIIKLSRIKKIVKNSGVLLVSENIDAQLFDIINYAVFGLIKLERR